MNFDNAPKYHLASLDDPIVDSVDHQSMFNEHEILNYIMNMNPFRHDGKRMILNEFLKYSAMIFVGDLRLDELTGEWKFIFLI